jgi:membrane-bound ClpP family serine protease
MAGLLDPNVAYLIIVGATFFVLVALAVPGTGIPELAALFAITISAYAVYNLFVNWWALALVLASLVPFFFAVRGPRREVWLVLSIVGLTVGSLFFFPGQDTPVSVNPVLALATSVIYALVLWILARKIVQSAQRTPIHSLSTLTDQRGEAKTMIRDEGAAQVGGELWSARSDELIPAGSAIKVVGRDGFVLIVERDRSRDSQRL